MKSIGIIGGMGPMAGVDLHRKIIEETVAGRDQEHVNVVHLSYSQLVPDRTDWLLDGTGFNPARGIISVIQKLEQMRVTAAGVPCNTAHARAIMGQVRFTVRESGFGLKLLHMIQETVAHIEAKHTDVHDIALLATTGTAKAGVYSEVFDKTNRRLILPDAALQDRVHQSIYHPEYGIKSTSCIHPKVISELEAVISELKSQGAGAVILGCTELPLAITDTEVLGLPTIDPTRVLARALIREVAPEQLKDA